jgi:hypothetical protein
MATESRVFEGRIEDAIARAKKAIQTAQDCVGQAKAANDASLEIVDRVRRNRHQKTALRNRQLLRSPAEAKQPDLEQYRRLTRDGRQSQFM